MKTNEYIKYVMISLIGTYEPILQSIGRRKLKCMVIQLDMTILEKQSSKVWLKVIVNVADQKENGLITSKNGVS